MMKTNKSFKGLQLFIQGTNIISQKINDFLSLLDPAFHRGLKNLKEFTLRFPAVKIFVDVDSLLMGGRSLIFNRETPLHFDNRDLLTGWPSHNCRRGFCNLGAQSTFRNFAYDSDCFLVIWLQYVGEYSIMKLSHGLEVNGFL